MNSKLAFLMVLAVVGLTTNAWAGSVPRVFWVPQTKTISVDSQGGSFPFEVTVSRVQEWEETEYFQDRRYVSRPVMERGTCEGWDCSSTAGTGKSALWDSFYGARKEQKTQRLADAIKGVGEATAEKLIAANVFSSKPRSWDAFASAIRQAERSGVIGSDITYQVLVKYRAENLVNLGYSAGSCKVVTYSCDVWVDRYVWEEFTNSRQVTRRNIIDTVRRSVEVVVRDPVLQNFERDVVTVAVGNELNDVSATVEGHTIYQQSLSHMPDRTQLQMLGIDRIKGDLPEAALGNARYQMSGSSPLFTFQVDAKYIPQLQNADDQLVLRYVIRTCKPNFLGFCVGRWTDSEPQFFPIASSESSLRIPVEKGLKTALLYSVSRKNSKWYNDNFLRDRETDDFKVK